MVFSPTPSRAAIALIRSAFGHQPQHLVLALGELTERIGIPAAPNQARTRSSHR